MKTVLLIISLSLSEFSETLKTNSGGLALPDPRATTSIQKLISPNLSAYSATRFKWHKKQNAKKTKRSLIDLSRGMKQTQFARAICAFAKPYRGLGHSIKSVSGWMPTFSGIWDSTQLFDPHQKKFAFTLRCRHSEFTIQGGICYPAVFARPSLPRCKEPCALAKKEGATVVAPVSQAR
jgi:hypothetical protein